MIDVEELSKEFCRICTRENCHFINIHTIDSDCIEFAEKLNFCVANTVYENDVLPDLLCEKCCSHLKIAYAFKVACLKTRKRFKNESIGKEIEMKSMKIETSDSDASDSKLEELRIEEVFSDIIGGNGGKVEEKCEEKEVKPNLSRSQCQMCGKVLKLNNDLLCSNCVKPGPEFTCTRCNFSFEKQSFFDAHMRGHTGEKPYRCSICLQSFAWNHHLQRHINKEHYTIQEYQASDFTGGETEENAMPKKLYKCPECNKPYNRQSSMLKHLQFYCNSSKNSKKIAQTIITCSICQKQFYGKNKLIIHMRSHTGEKPFSCEICQKSFSQRGYLTYHMRVHTGEKPYRCEHCGKCFTQKTSLVTHRRLHEAETPLLEPEEEKSMEIRGDSHISSLILPPRRTY